MATPISISPMAVSGVRHLVERAYRESGELQYLRELLVNALEAGARRVEFGPEWGAVEREGVYRLMVADNGRGMGPNELLKFLNTFGGGGKPIGDAHENFGVGAKTSLLPWNPAGVVVLSWTKANPEGAMVWLMRDPATGEYGARKFQTGAGDYDEVVRPYGEWDTVRPEWLTSHGTVVVCLGTTGREDTFLGKGGDGDIKGISAYLNKRIWEVPAGVDIFVQELRSQSRKEWPRSLEEARGPAGQKPDRRWNRRQIRGARHFATHSEGSAKGKLHRDGHVLLSDGTRLEWYLWEGERPAVHSYAHKSGYIAALYKNELYDTHMHGATFRTFGITQAAVRERLTLIAVPPLADGSYGVYPDTARNSLRILGTRRAGDPLPWMEWASEFAQALPEPIRHALAQAAPSSSGTLQDATWRERLMDRFGSRWRTLRYRAEPHGPHLVTPDESTAPNRGTTRTAAPKKQGTSAGVVRPASQGVLALAKLPNAAGTTPAAALKTRGGVPEYQWTTAADIDADGSTAVAWCPPSTEHPDGLVQLARDFPVIVEVKRFWRERYPDHLGDEVDAAVEGVYGEVMVARIAHSESLVSDPHWGRARVNDELRAPSALTMALLGLVSEDHLIATRLSAMGVKRKTT